MNKKVTAAILCSILSSSLACADAWQPAYKGSAGKYGEMLAWVKTKKPSLFSKTTKAVVAIVFENDRLKGTFREYDTSKISLEIDCEAKLMTATSKRSTFYRGRLVDSEEIKFLSNYPIRTDTLIGLAASFSCNKEERETTKAYDFYNLNDMLIKTRASFFKYRNPKVNGIPDPVN